MACWMEDEGAQYGAIVVEFRRKVTIFVTISSNPGNTMTGPKKGNQLSSAVK